MKKTRLRVLLAVALVAVLGLALASSTPAVAGDDAQQKVKKIRIKKEIHDCESEECKDAEHHHKMIVKEHGDMDQIDVECEDHDCEGKVHVFISKDGTMQKLSVTPGEPMKWVEEGCEGDDCERQVKVIVKKAGDMEEIHSMIAGELDEECEGEDCKKKMIFISKDGDVHKAHAMAGDHAKWIQELCDGEECDDDIRVIVKKIKGGDMDDIHKMISSELAEECEGEDCKRKIIVIGGDGDMHKAHAMAGHKMIWNSEECEGEDCEQEHRIFIKKGDAAHEDFAWVGKHPEILKVGKGGFLGVQLVDLTAELRQYFGAAGDQGVMVGKVLAESAAQGAGLEVGDVVTTVDGESVGSAGALSGAIRSREGGTSVELGVVRDGQPVTVTAVLGEKKMAAPRAAHKMVMFSGEGEGTEMEVSQHGADYDCGGAKECTVKVECKEDGCTCTANGEPIDCKELNLTKDE